MFKKIILHTGSFALSWPIEMFCTINNDLLRKHGLHYPLQLGCDDLSGYSHYFIFYYAMFKPAELESILRDAALPHTAGGATTLCLSSPWFMRTTDSMRNILNACKAVFPDSLIAIFHSFTDQPTELEGVFYAGVLRHGSLTPKLHWVQGFPKYKDRLEFFNEEVGANNFFFYIDSHLQGNTHQTLEIFLQACSLSKKKLLEEGANFNIPVEYFLISPEQARFMTAVNQVAKRDAFSFLSWGSQKRLLAQSEGKRRPFFSLEHHETILEQFEDENASLAAQFGKKQLFPALRSELPHALCIDLSLEEAVSVTKSLDQKFSIELLSVMESIPQYYLEYNARIVKKALQIALYETDITHETNFTKSKVSILTLTYNHASFIEKNIQSVIEQKTNFLIEHIIADDGSDDGTQDIILSYAKHYPHIIPVFQKNRSYGPTNVRALFEMARSPYVALCDGDDYFTDPNKLQIQADFLDAHQDCALCFHPVKVTYEDDPTRQRFYPPTEELPRGVKPFYYLSDLIKCNLIQTNSVMYRWRFTNGLPNWFRSDLMPGDWYWHLLHAEKGKIGFLTKVMSVYHRHKKSVYYQSEIDRLKHRYTVGVQELNTYDVINNHFEHRFESILLDLTNGVFADCLLYAEKINNMNIIEKLAAKFPYFARHFLDSLKIASIPKTL